MPCQSTPQTCQLLVTPPARGAKNMAVDESLLSIVAQTGQPVMRFYQWQSPTLSLGYFQKSLDRSKHTPSQNAELVRRLSGGGAILHDRELTYSLLIPTSHWLSRDTQTLYNLVHQAIAETINHFLTSAQSPYRAVLCEQSSGLAADAEPFLCFQRRSAGDILLRKATTSSTTAHEYKIVGSAQRRKQGVILQHGSLLLNHSPAAPELLGIAEITHLNISPAHLVAHLPERLAKKISLDFVESQLLTEQFDLNVQDLSQDRYLNPAWTHRR